MASIRLEDLNPAQREAVTAGDGPMLIVAGAGSGKTRVLTYRIAYLLAERKLDAAQLLAVTFTNKAAAEMRERIGTLLGANARWPWISTFHSACARILREEAGALGLSRNFTIFDDSETLSILRRLIGEANLAESPAPEQARSRIDQAKNEGLFPEDLISRAGGQREVAMAELYRLYQERLRAMNALDFGDLLLLCSRLFERNAGVLARWQGRFTHLLVDEYQDTNRVQYQLVRTLSAHTGNLCVVGDEDQSIYRWRGADIRNILDFERDFPAARIFKLEQNYRSTKTILAAADTVISNNSERKPKRLWTENPTGDPVVCFTGLTERDEADFIVREIGRLAAEGQFRLGEFVVFYRTNAQSRAIEEAMMRHRVPYYVVGGLRFYERAEIKDLIAYLRVIANPADALSLERMIGAPPRGIGARTLEALAAAAARESITMFDALGRAEALSAIALRIAKLAGALYLWMRDLAGRAPAMTVRAILEEVIAQARYTAYLDAMQDGAERRENVGELLSAAAIFDNDYGPGGLGEFLERIALVNDSDELGAQGSGRVALMTLHTSKGLEYPVVFIGGMEEGLFPHSRAQDSGIEVEEERRLCYVGMTRARRLLYLTNTMSREIYGIRLESRPSRFLAEIDSSLIRRIAPDLRMPPLRMAGSHATMPREPYVDYTESQLPDDDGPDELRIGARVTHPTFGAGIVRRREGRGEAAKAWVDFERGGIKLLVLKFAHLRAIAR